MKKVVILIGGLVLAYLLVLWGEDAGKAVAVKPDLFFMVFTLESEPSWVFWVTTLVGLVGSMIWLAFGVIKFLQETESPYATNVEAFFTMVLLCFGAYVFGWFAEPVQATGAEPWNWFSGEYSWFLLLIVLPTVFFVRLMILEACWIIKLGVRAWGDRPRA